MPSSTTRLVDAISNTMAAVKLAPLRNRARASATAAYEHDDDAAPSPVATARARGLSSPRRRSTVLRRTTAWTTEARMKPRIRAHRISHVIDPDTSRAWPRARSALTGPPRGRATVSSWRRQCSSSGCGNDGARQ